MSRMRPDIEYVKGYSIALLCLGVFLLLGALQFRFTFRGTEDDPVFALISSLLCLLGIPCLVVSLLRWMRVAAALPATAALSFCLLVVPPFGTLLSLYWLKKVRPRELTPQDPPHRAWFNYTVALYILGLVMLDMFLVLRYVQILPGPEDRFLEILTWGGLILALAALAVGALRSSRSAWAHWATFALNALLVLWFPLGTALALVWFFGVRKHERTILVEDGQESQSQGDALG
jgi:uncharacterized membrane protein YidH (DUF202 family)